MTTKISYTGVWPVMLTPFNEVREIDWDSLKRLIDWYIAAGVHGLFANCQSSEMFYLSEQESLQLTRFVLEYVADRVPVVASGHTASALSQQIAQLTPIATSGVASVILISNRLAAPSEDDAVMLANLQTLTNALPADVGIGIYECPWPYKRLLSEKIIRWCAESGRFTFIKDTCCDLAMIKQRLTWIKGSRLHIANANGQTLLPSLQAGVHGYSGVMANFHPELYVWLYENWQKEPLKAQILADFLSTASLVESLDYPICAKDFQCVVGNFKTAQSRVRDGHHYYHSNSPTTMQQMLRLGEALKTLLGIMDARTENCK